MKITGAMKPHRFRSSQFWIISILSIYLHSFNHVDGFYTQRQRYASRMLKITPKECNSPDFPNVTGICMISLECQQRSGTVIGACRDRHLFGACCHNPEASSTQPNHESSESPTSTTVASTLPSTTTTTTTSTTTTTTTTTPPPPSSEWTSTTSTELPSSPLASTIFKENEPLELITSTSTTERQDPPASERSDSTSIPSLIDTFSELSPTFLSQLALDEHTTGRYAGLSSPHDLINRGQSTAEDASSSAPVEDTMPTFPTFKETAMSAKPSYPPAFVSSSTAKLEDIYHDAEGHEAVFKDSMIKFIDDIVTTKTVPEEIPQEMDAINGIPYSTFSRTSTQSTENSSPVAWSWIPSSSPDPPSSTFTHTSTQSTERSSPVAWSWIPSSSADPPSSTFTRTSTQSTERSSPAAWSWIPSSSADSPSSTFTRTSTQSTESSSPVASSWIPSSSADPPSSTFTRTSTQSTESSSPVAWSWTPGSSPDPPSSTFASTEKDRNGSDENESSTTASSKSEEILAVSVKQTVSPSSTESNEITTFPTSSTESSSPAKFTFSKLKYTPRPYKPRPTTKKVVYTRPPSSTTPTWESLPLKDEEEGDTDDDKNTRVSSSTIGTTSTERSQSSMDISTELSQSPVATSTEQFQSSMDMSTERSQSQLVSSTEQFQSSIDMSTERSQSPMTMLTERSPSPMSMSSTERYQRPVAMSSTERYQRPVVMSYTERSQSPMALSSTELSQVSSLYESSPASENWAFTSPTSGLPLVSQSSYYDWPTSTSEKYLKRISSSSTSTTDKSVENEVNQNEHRIAGNASRSDLNEVVPFSSAPTASTRTSNVKTSSAPVQGASWDTSIDSFVDQVMNGIVQNLNKSNKTDAIIFNASSEKKNTSPTPITPTLSALASSVRTLIEKVTEKTIASTKPKTTTTIAPTSAPRKDIPKEKKKVKGTKAPSKSKGKIKLKPIKKVTTVKTANSTRKRLDFKRDCGVRPLIKKGRIVGGTPSRFGSWPWHALVKETVWWGIFSKIKCGGVLIGAQHVLTAAHCQPQQTGTLSVVLGITDSDEADSRAITKTVRRVIPHPQFNARTYENDIALLELDSPVDFQPHIVPICLPRDEDELEGKTAYVTGMGLLKHDGERPLILQEVDLPILNNTECQKMFVRSGNKKPIIESFICAGYEQGRKDSCGGDSGGPLSVKRGNGQWVLAGTVSHGIKCAVPDQPGVYMRTSYYKPWIDRVLSVARSRYRGIPRCNAPPLICARQRHQQQARNENGFVHTLFRIFRLARKMVDEKRSADSSRKSA